MDKNKTFQLGGVMVGAGKCPLLLPDIGTFFNQDMEQAEQMIRQLAEAGVKTVKGEVLQRADIALDVDYEDEYLVREGQLQKENYRRLIERKVLSLEDYERLFTLCRNLGMQVVVSIYDFEGAKFAADQDCVALKIASSNITHQPLIEYVARLGLPMIMDTGRANLSEIARAVNWAEKAGVRHLIIQQSPKAPPAPVSEHNLRFMETLRQTFGCQVGLSDHHAGTEMLLAATVMDVAVLEKGVYPDGVEMDQGIYHAMPVSQVGETLKQIQQIHAALGDGRAPLETQPHRARMGLVAKTDLPAGAVLSLDMVDFAFPALGIGAQAWPEVDKAVLKHPVADGSVIRWSDLEPRNA
jgi:sialic acid synthase SpsE